MTPMAMQPGIPLRKPSFRASLNLWNGSAAVALWWYNRVKRSEVDLDSFADPYLDQVRVYLRERGRRALGDRSHLRLEHPGVRQPVAQTNGREERIVPGFGPTSIPMSLLRAVTEMNQMLTNLPEEPPLGPGTPIDDEETLEWLRSATVDNQPYLLPDAAADRRSAKSYPRSWTDDVAEDIRMCQALVEGRDEDVGSEPDAREIGLPVVKVIVPGLRHFWARYTPGRLYDVPVRLGWLSAPTPEEELNPIPMFL